MREEKKVIKMSEIPVIQITLPKIEKEYKLSGKKEDTKGSITTIYNYDESHLIYKLQGLGSMKEISTLKDKIDKAIEKINWYNEEVLENPKGTTPPLLTELLSILKRE